MKKLLKRGLSICLALALAMPQVFASDALGSDLKKQSVRLGTGTELTGESFWSATYSDLRTESYLTYTPNQTVSPAVWYGSTVSSLQTLSTAAQALSGQGYRVLAGINGGFYNTDGTAVGLVLTDGIIRSLDKDNYYMVGFGADGSVFIDDSTISKTVSWFDMAGGQSSLSITAINASRKNGGLYLFSEDFGTSMKNTLGGVDVVLRPLGGDEGLKMNSSTLCQVVAVNDSTAEGAAIDNAIPAGCLVLSANKNCDASLLDTLRNMGVGTQVTLDISGGDGRWATARYGITGLYSLVEDGQVTSGLPTGAAPRTAIGIRADGSVVFYTIDGRQSGYSVGASHSQTAKRLIELGCVEAVALDGGGSTTIGASLPGDTAFSILNKPSGGSERKVSNCILLVTAAPASGMMNQIYVQTESDVLLAGGETLVGARPADANGYPASAGGTLSWSSAGGTFYYDETGSTHFVAGSQPGLYEVTASAAGYTGSASVRVVDHLSDLTVTRTDFGTEVNSVIILSPGEVLDLNAEGTWYNLPVGMDDTQVEWTAEGAIGEIDRYGVITAGMENGEGTVTATAGGRSVTVSVRVDRGDPFTDVATHWAQPYITRLYKMGLTTGTQLEDGTYIYQPDNSLTRGQLLVFLTRMLGVDTEQYAGVELPFADLDGIEDWLLPSVKAMYALQVFSGTMESGVLYANVNGLVTREAAMTMLGRILAKQQSCDLTVFLDGGSVSDWASVYVQTLVAQGVVGGSDGYLNPQKNMTRGEIAKVLTLVCDLPLGELTPRS